MKKTIAVFSTLIIIVFTLIIILNIYTSVRERSTYEAAVCELEKGKYAQAITHFEELGSYRDSALLCEYAQLRADFDIESEEFIVCSYPTITKIDTEYDGSRFESDIASDRAIISDMYYNIAAQMAY